MPSSRGAVPNPSGANADPLERYRELISEAWEVATSIRYAAKIRRLVLAQVSEFTT